MTSEAERRMARYKEERRRQLALQVAARLSSAASSSEEEESDKVSYAEYRRRRRRREAGGRGEAPGLLKHLSRRSEDGRTGGSLQQLRQDEEEGEVEHIYQTIGSLASLPGTLTAEPARSISPNGHAWKYVSKMTMWPLNSQRILVAFYTRTNS